MAAEERLIEQGVYTYAVDSQPTGIHERFSIHLRPDGARITRVTRDARARFGATILLQAESAPPPRERDLCAFEVRLLREGKARMQDVRSRYTLTTQSARERSIDDDPPCEQVLALPDGVVVSPLMRVFLGPAIAAVAARGRGAEVPVLTPYLEDLEDADRILFGFIMERYPGPFQAPGARNDSLSSLLLDVRRIGNPSPEHRRIVPFRGLKR